MIDAAEARQRVTRFLNDWGRPAELRRAVTAAIRPLTTEAARIARRLTPRGAPPRTPPGRRPLRQRVRKRTAKGRGRAAVTGRVFYAGSSGARWQQARAVEYGWRGRPAVAALKRAFGEVVGPDASRFRAALETALAAEAQAAAAKRLEKD